MKKAPRIEDLPSVSVVIPALNESAYIERTIEQLLEQRYPSEKLEIIVVDGGSTDGTVDVLMTLVQQLTVDIQILHNPKKLSSISRNMGVRSSRHDYILFIDAHVHIPTTALIRNMAEAIMEHQPSVLGRPQPLTPPSLSIFQESTAAARASFFGHSRTSYIYREYNGWVSPLSIGVMYKRTLFDIFGPFDESFDAAEDLEFNSRLEDYGFRALISPKFKIYYYPRKSVYQLFHQMHRYGLGRVQFLKKRRNRRLGEALVPCLVSALPLVLITASSLFESARNALAVTTVMGILVVIGTSVVHLPRVRVTSIALIPLCFLVLHLGLGSGVVRGLLRQPTLNGSPEPSGKPTKRNGKVSL